MRRPFPWPPAATSHPATCCHLSSPADSTARPGCWRWQPGKRWHRSATPCRGTATASASPPAPGTPGTAALVEVLQAIFLTTPEEAPPAQFPSSITNAPASQLGILEKLGGPNLTFVEKQASGLRAVVEAARLLDHARAEAVLACGVDEAQWLNAEGFDRLGVLARPGRAGMRLGEGAAVLLLSPTPSDTSLARLAGWGMASSCSEPWLYPEDPRRPRPGVPPGAGRRRHGRRRHRPRDVARQRHPLPRRPRAGRPPGRARGPPPRRAGAERAPRRGRFASTLRALVAALVVSGRVMPAWIPAPHLADAGYRPLAARPRSALVTAMAAGGSCLAAVLTAVD